MFLVLTPNIIRKTFLDNRKYKVDVEEVFGECVRIRKALCKLNSQRSKTLFISECGCTVNNDSEDAVVCTLQCIHTLFLCGHGSM